MYGDLDLDVSLSHEDAFRLVMDDFDPHTQVRGCVGRHVGCSRVCAGWKGGAKTDMTDVTGLNHHPVRPLPAKSAVCGCCGVCCC